MKFRQILFFSVVVLSASAVREVDVTFSVQPDNRNHAISPLIYGTNYNMYMTGNENLGFYRIGGNRLSGYNWENNWSNAGHDWRHFSDGYMIPEGADGSIPAITYTSFIENNIQPGAGSLLTLQMAGYVSADGNGAVTDAETAPSARWVPVYPRKNKPFALTPDLNDNAVYLDELVNFMVDRYGRAADGGVLGYSLGNEPTLWPETHPRIHSDQPLAQELIDRSVALASAVKDVDSSAKIFGPALFGFLAYFDFKIAPDWPDYADQYAWFIDFYLDKMREASDVAGTRLLDVVDLHWYSEAIGDQRVIVSGATSRNDQIARLQAPRTFWDPDYQEDSWIGEYFSSYLPLIPRIQNDIDANYPGTKLAFTEYSFGGGSHITGGLAQADVLGIFGKFNVYASAAWLFESDSSYIAAAYQLYRNYDGANSSFGDFSVTANMSDKENSSIYASVNAGTDELHLVVINKNLDESLRGNFVIDSGTNYQSGTAYALTQDSLSIQNMGAFQVSDNNFSYSLPPLSAYHFVLTDGL